MLPGLICWQIVGSSGSMGKSFKPSGEPSVVRVQQRNHGDAAEGADGREQTNQWTHFYGFRPRHGRLSVVIRTPLRMRIRSSSARLIRWAR